MPAGTPGTFAYTRDEKASAKAYYSATLPTAGWAPARDGEEFLSYASVWLRDQTNLVMLLDTPLTEGLTDCADTLDIHLPDADVVIVATYVWEAE